MLAYFALALRFASLPVLVVAAIAWRRQLLFALPFLTILNGLTIPVGTSAVRIDQLAACVLVAPLALAVLTGTRRLRTDAIVWWLAAILGVNVVSSVLHSPALSYSLLQCANIASAWAIYVVLINSFDSFADLERYFTLCLWAAMAGGIIGITAFALAIIGVPVGGAEVSQQAATQQFVRPYGAYGTMQEPNIFGSYAGAYLVLAIGLLGAARTPFAKSSLRMLRYLAAVMAAALVVSFTRAAWISTTLAILGLTLFATGAEDHRVRWSRVLIPVGVVVAVGLAITFATGTAGDLLRYKLLNLVNYQSATAELRLTTYLVGLDQWIEHPVIGWGTYTFAPLLAQGADFQRFEGWRNLWIGNFLILALHDTGVVGLALWIGLLWTIFRRGVRSLNPLRALDPAAALRTRALIVAIASLLIPFLATTGFSLGYSWLLIGLLGAHCHLAASRLEVPVRGS
jgi:O-antigen ligase